VITLPFWLAMCAFITLAGSAWLAGLKIIQKRCRTHEAAIC
jgi:hypothetical protein